MNVSWQSRLVHASTGAAGDNRSCPLSYAPSTRRHGVSLRQNIACRVPVPVMDAAALVARPGSDLKRQRLGHMVAIRAASAAGKEAVDEPELLAVPGALVGEHLAEGGQADVRNRPSELPVEHHVPHAQVLQAEDIVSPHKACGLLCKVVPAAVGDLKVHLGTLSPLAMPAAPALNPAGERRHVGNAEIDPRAPARLRKRIHVFVQAEGHEVLPSTALGYRNRAGLTPELPEPADTQVPNLGQTQVVVLPVPRERATGELGSLLPVLRLEAGERRPPGLTSARKG